MIRLDKYLCKCTFLTRKEASAAIRDGRVTLDGAPVRMPEYKIGENAQGVCLDGRALVYSPFAYIMLNKPAGFVSSTDDPSGPTVLSLLPEKERRGLFPCGRLDKNTTGLLILTDDGGLSHVLLSPKKHVRKIYRFTVERPVTPEDQKALEEGVDIGVCVTKPCKIELTGQTEGFITLTEGKYHQIKEMFKNRMNKVLYLQRVSFGGLSLDDGLPEGAYRPLTEAEIALLRSNIDFSAPEV